MQSLLQVSVCVYDHWLITKFTLGTKAQSVYCVYRSKKEKIS